MSITLTQTQVKDNQTITTELQSNASDFDKSRHLTKIRDFSELSSSLKAIAPPSSETTQLITYALIATAVVGIFVYHYIREQEQKLE